MSRQPTRRAAAPVPLAFALSCLAAGSMVFAQPNPLHAADPTDEQVTAEQVTAEQNTSAQNTSAQATSEEVTAQQVRVSLRRGVDFFRKHASAGGGYVYQISADLKRREGEEKVGDQTAWVEPPGTPVRRHGVLGSLSIVRR